MVRPGVDLSVFQQQTLDSDSRRQKWEKTHFGNSSDKVKGQVLDDLAAFLQPPKRFQEESSTTTPREVIVVGYVGRLSPEKSPGMFLRLAEAVLADRRGLKQQVVKFLIVGDGPLLPYLYGFAENKLGLTVEPPNVAELLFVQVDRLISNEKASYPCSPFVPRHAATPLLCLQCHHFSRQLPKATVFFCTL